jgi:hypothetical protein
MTTPFLRPNAGRGAEIREYLCRELGIPADAKWFEVRFAVDELVTVTCSYMPRVREEETKK